MVNKFHLQTKWIKVKAKFVFMLNIILISNLFLTKELVNYGQRLCPLINFCT